MTEGIPDLLKGFTIVRDYQVAWGEMDAFQHVNNTVYFRYFENARIAYLDALKFDPKQHTVGPILASTQCRFKAPLSYPDSVSVGVRADGVSEDRFTTLYEIYSHKLERIVAKGDGVIVAYDYQTKSKSQFPQSFLDAVKKLEKR